MWRKRHKWLVNTLKNQKEIGNWTLTAAAYNAGPAGIKRYMDIQKVGDYYDLLLGQETGRYVFRIMAIKEIVSNPDKYGFAVSKTIFTTQYLHFPLN